MRGEAALVSSSSLLSCGEIDTVYQAELPRPHLVWKFPQSYQTLSWALHGGGWRLAPSIAWLQVSNAELGPEVCALSFLRDGLAQLEQAEAVGLMTSARVAHFQTASVTRDALVVHALVTVGLGNALRAGDPTSLALRSGTINIACCANQALSFPAALEAMTIITEAKVAALSDRHIISRMSRKPATGTGTDCHVLAFPPEGEVHIYAGKHTSLGSAIGAVVYEALVRGIDDWRQRYPEHPVLGDHK